MAKSWMTRAAGVLLPVSSLPSKYGIGTFGKAAYKWVDFLSAAGQKYWQVLPLGPTSYGDSPYQSFSAFAGNPYFVDLDLLCKQGLLKKKKCKKIHWGDSPSQVDYGTIYQYREKVLRKAFSRFEDKKALEQFRKKNSDWIEDYALYMAVKAKMDLKAWNEWDEDIRMRRPAALKKWKAACAEDVEYHIFVQYLFFQQWNALKTYANEKGISIIGDAPIYVAMDSADVWANPQLFQLDEDNVPTEVAGCPPDAFSADGQLWGNPLYRWDVMEKDGFKWWIKRLKANLTMVDVLRIDHFRGLESYYAIPYGDTTARNGRWRKGPDMAFISAINKAFGTANIIAEDLGYLTPAVKKLLKNSGYPGMKVLEFAFDSREESDYMPHNYQNNCVVYTGTHDNDTVRGWFTSANPDDVAIALEYMGLPDDTDGNWGFIRAALSSVADLAVVPMQDYLDLGSEARINTPSTLGGNNWRWRMTKDQLTPELAEKMARMAKLYGRKRDEEE
jgi:4-alpha-glucanotransferase